MVFVNLSGHCIWQGRRVVGEATVKLIPDWATTTSYAVNDPVQKSGKWYICATAHTSGTFATDLAAGDWTEIPIVSVSRIHFSAPTSSHTAGEDNTGYILVGINATSNATGGIAVSNDDYWGNAYACSNPLVVTLTGFNSGDEVEVQIFQNA